MQSPLQLRIARLTLIRHHIESIETACEGLYFDNVSSFHRSSWPFQSSQPFLTAIVEGTEMTWPWSAHWPAAPRSGSTSERETDRLVN
jgi:hypothetical protein